jgi:hypothetical protein
LTIGAKIARPPAIVTRHIERVSDKATERIYDRSVVMSLAGR